MSNVHRGKWLKRLWECRIIKKRWCIRLLIYRGIDIQGHRGNITAWSITARIHTNAHVRFAQWRHISVNTYLLPPPLCVHVCTHASPIYAYTWRSDALFTGDQQYQRHARRDNNYSIFSEKHRNRRCTRPSKALERSTHPRMKGPKFPVDVFVTISGTFTISLLNRV